MKATIVSILIAGTVIPLCIWAFRVQIRICRKMRLWELENYIEDLYKIPCSPCYGDGYEGYTLEGEPTGEICEVCDSYGYLWRSICPPRWLKHSAIWREPEVGKLRLKSRQSLR